MYNCGMDKNGSENSNGTSQPVKGGFNLPLGSKAGGLSFSVAVLINLLLGLFAGIIIGAFSLSGTEADKYISLLVSPIAIAITLTLSLTVAKQPPRKLLPLKTHPKYFVIGILLAFGALFSLSWINDLIVQLIQLMGYVPRDAFVPDVTGWKVVPVLITVAVIPAIMEEILFRGLILQNAESGMGTIRAVLVSGFCFSLYHGSVEQTVYQFILGCIFGFLAVRSHSIAPTVLVHFLNNAVIIIMLACGLCDETTGAFVVSDVVQIALYVVSALCLIGGLVWLFLCKEENKPCAKGGVREFFIWASVGIGIMALNWILGLFVQ